MQVNKDLYKIDSSGKFNSTFGLGKVKVIIPDVEPIIVDLYYNIYNNGKFKFPNKKPIFINYISISFYKLYYNSVVYA